MWLLDAAKNAKDSASGYVASVQEKASYIVSTVQDEAQSVLDSISQRNLNPIEEPVYEELQAYNEFKLQFNLESKTDDIAKILANDSFISELHSNMVPMEIAYEEFWSRYYFRHMEPENIRSLENPLPKKIGSKLSANEDNILDQESRMGIEKAPSISSTEKDGENEMNKSHSIIPILEYLKEIASLVDRNGDIFEYTPAKGLQDIHERIIQLYFAIRASNEFQDKSSELSQKIQENELISEKLSQALQDHEIQLKKCTEFNFQRGKDQEHLVWIEREKELLLRQEKLQSELSTFQAQVNSDVPEEEIQILQQRLLDAENTLQETKILHAKELESMKTRNEFAYNSLQEELFKKEERFKLCAAELEKAKKTMKSAEEQYKTLINERNSQNQDNETVIHSLKTQLEAVECKDHSSEMTDCFDNFRNKTERSLTSLFEVANIVDLDLDTSLGKCNNVEEICEFFIKTTESLLKNINDIKINMNTCSESTDIASSQIQIQELSEEIRLWKARAVKMKKLKEDIQLQKTNADKTLEERDKKIVNMESEFEAYRTENDNKCKLSFMYGYKSAANELNSKSIGELHRLKSELVDLRRYISMAVSDLNNSVNTDVKNTAFCSFDIGFESGKKEKTMRNGSFDDTLSKKEYERGFIEGKKSVEIELNVLKSELSALKKYRRDDQLPQKRNKEDRGCKQYSGETVSVEQVLDSELKDSSCADVKFQDDWSEWE